MGENMNKYKKSSNESHVVARYIPEQSRIQLAALVNESTPRFRSELWTVMSDTIMGPKPPPDILNVFHQEFLKEGVDISRTYGGIFHLITLFGALTEEHLLFALKVTSQLLKKFDRLADQQNMEAYHWKSQASFENFVNEILNKFNFPLKLQNANMIENTKDAASTLRKALLMGEGDPASKAHGDIQVEMVSSSIQMLLSKPGAKIIDYGAGLGRILQGLETADLLTRVNYVCVEENPDKRLTDLVKRKGVTLCSREEFFKQDITAHGIMIVNTLHHMPFKDIPRQFNKMLNSLDDGGVLLVHEMGLHKVPEAWNVPWSIENIKCLFENIPGLMHNSRSTESKGGVPLSHCVLTVDQKRDFTNELSRNVEKTWRLMKRSTLLKIEELYKLADVNHEPELARVLAINANLDLNPPAKA